MNLSDLVSSRFTFVDADWRVDDSSRLFEAVTPLADAPTHVVVQRVDVVGGHDDDEEDEDEEREYNYVFAVDDVVRRLRDSPGDMLVRDALQLHEWMAAPVIDIGTPVGAAPVTAIVHESGHLVGVLDMAPPPAPPAAAPPVGSAGGRRGGRVAAAPPAPPPAAPPAAAPAPPPAATRGGTGPAPGAPPAAPPAAAPERVDRSVVATLPEVIAQGDVVSLLVELSAPETDRLGIDVSLPAGSDIRVIVQPRRGLAIDGRAEGSLTVVAGTDTLPLQFDVRAVDVGPAELRVLAFHEGQPLGALTITPEVVPATAEGGRGTGPASSHEGALAPVSLRLADLSMLILERATKGEFEIQLNSPNPALGLNYRKFGPIQVNDPAEYFRRFFGEIENLPLDTPGQRSAVERALAERGTFLFESLFPPPLRELLWSLRSSITSVVIQSEEPWIPWELCKMVGEEGGRLVEGPFFSEAFAVSRWVPEVAFQDALSLRNMALVVPADSGLPMATAERDYVLSLAGDQRRVTPVPARATDLQAGFASGEFDVWHFTGHGVADDQSADASSILLEAGQRFQPQSLTGTARNLRLGKPLVFLNACQVGRSGLALTGSGGWAQRFIGAGAAAFVGTYWSVSDTPACTFARELYDRLVRGAPIGMAVKEARAAIRAPDDPTWLAYTLFAHPLASVTA